jgi:nitrite reductase/ring-hydroxylating ferredoxin subunit
MTWIEALTIDEVPPGNRKAIKIGTKKLLIINHEDKIYAVENSCPHLKIPITKGEITADCAIICPFHRSSFDLETGNVKEWTPFPPIIGKVMGMMTQEKSLAVFPTRVESGKIMVDL